MARRDLAAEEEAAKGRRQTWLELGKSLFLLAVLIYLYFLLKPVYFY